VASVAAAEPDTSTRFSAPLSLPGAGGESVPVDQVVVQPVASADFLAGIPDGMRIEVQAAPQTLPSDVSQAQLGSLGGGNAVALAAPVDLRLLAKDIASSAEVPLSDGAQALTYQVSLPILAQPTNAGEVFTWLIEVQEDGNFLGYMRYPSTFDARTNTQVYELSAQVLQNSAVLPVILQASRVQAFMGDVHSWSSPFKTGVDFGVLGPVWGVYDVLAPQVGGRIGVLSPDGSDMIWIDASGVGPASSTAVSPPAVVAPDALATPVDAPALVDPDGITPLAEPAVVEPTVGGAPADVAVAVPEVAGEP
jgi:hypothetical protein